MGRTRKSGEGRSPIWMEASKHSRRLRSSAGKSLFASGTQLASDRFRWKNCLINSADWAIVLRAGPTGKKRASLAVVEILVGRFGQGPSRNPHQYRSDACSGQIDSTIRLHSIWHSERSNEL